MKVPSYGLEVDQDRVGVEVLPPDPIPEWMDDTPADFPEFPPELDDHTRLPGDYPEEADDAGGAQELHATPRIPRQF